MVDCCNMSLSFSEEFLFTKIGIFVSDFRYFYYTLDNYSSIAENVVSVCFIQDFTDPDEMAKLGDALTRLSEMEPPYLIHCVEGKDRTGFVVFLLENLMGASREKMERDYACSFVNYFHLEEAFTAEIGKRAAEGFQGMLGGSAREYLLRCGMTGESIERLMDSLCAEE